MHDTEGMHVRHRGLSQEGAHWLPHLPQSGRTLSMLARLAASMGLMFPNGFLPSNSSYAIIANAYTSTCDWQ